MGGEEKALKMDGMRSKVAGAMKGLLNVVRG